MHMHMHRDRALLRPIISRPYLGHISAISTKGFPCQPFSDRGSKAGLLDRRGQLYRELVRLLSARRPAAFLFENVASLRHSGHALLGGV